MSCINDYMQDGRYYQGVFLDKDDVAILLPYVKKQAEKCEAKYDYYRDIHEGGEATERQVTLMTNWEEKMEHWRTLEGNFEFFIGRRVSDERCRG